MKRGIALASLTAGLMLSVAPAIAQMQQKDPDSGGTPQMQRSPSGQSESGTSRPGADKSAEPKAKATGKDTAQGKEPADKGTAQSEPKGSKGTANQGIEPKGKASKGTAEKAAEPKDKATKGTAQKSPEPKDSATKGTAQKSPEPKDSATKGTAQKSPEPKDSATKGAGAAEKGSAGRAQVSEQQKSNIGQTLTKERSINRVTNVNVSINVGTRVPRSVHLVALPASVVAIVPSYRAYRYFVVGEQLCVVDPATYEIVDVIVVTNQTAVRSGGSATLVLTDTERDLVLREIDMREGSTLGLGALSEGADVPRGVQLRVFSSNVVERVPKLRDYKFFTAENRLAIVDPQGAKVQLLIESGR